MTSAMGSQGGASESPSPELVEQFRQNNALRRRIEEQSNRIKELEACLRARATEIYQLKSKVLMSSADAEGARDEAASVRKQMQDMLALHERDRERREKTVYEMNQAFQETVTQTTLSDAASSPPNVEHSSTGSTPDTSNLSEVVAPRVEKVKIQIKAQEVLSSYFDISFSNLSDGISHLKARGQIDVEEFDKLVVRFSKFSDERFQDDMQLVHYLEKVNKEANEAKHPPQPQPQFAAVVASSSTGSPGPSAAASASAVSSRRYPSQPIASANDHLSPAERRLLDQISATVRADGPRGTCISVLAQRHSMTFNREIRTNPGRNDGRFKAWLVSSRRFDFPAHEKHNLCYVTLRDV